MNAHIYKTHTPVQYTSILDIKIHFSNMYSACMAWIEERKKSEMKIEEKIPKKKKP